MNAQFGAELPGPCRRALDRWLHLWDVPHLEAKSRIEWSPRLTRSLGRSYPDKRLIRIASYLESAPDGLLQEVLCHEMAHLAARGAPRTKRPPPRPRVESPHDQRRLRAANAASLPERSPAARKKTPGPLRLLPPLPRLPALPTRAPPHEPLALRPFRGLVVLRP